MALQACAFQVYGKVQGVFFRNHTEKQANALGLKGWCMNTAQGTVQGEIQGPQEAVSSMKHWLQHTGSPKSKIERAEFTEERDITSCTYSGFEVRR